MTPPPIQPEQTIILRLADQKLSDPMTLAEVRKMVSEGRISPETPAIEPPSQEWQPVHRLIGSPQGQGFRQPSDSDYPWQQKPQPGKFGAMDLVAPLRADPWAVLAGYLGLFSFILIAAPFSLAVAIIALKSLKKHPERTGKGRAWFGLVMGVLGTPLLIWLIATLATRP